MIETLINSTKKNREQQTTKNGRQTDKWIYKQRDRDDGRLKDTVKDIETERPSNWQAGINKDKHTLNRSTISTEKN